MKPARTIQTTFWAMLTLQSVGTIDAQHRLPPPRAFVAVVTLWSILGVAAESGYGKLAARMSVLVLVTATVLGPFGKRLVVLLETVAHRFAIDLPGTRGRHGAAGQSGSITATDGMSEADLLVAPAPYEVTA